MIWILFVLHWIGLVISMPWLYNRRNGVFITPAFMQFEKKYWSIIFSNILQVEGSLLHLIITVKPVYFIPPDKIFFSSGKSWYVSIKSYIVDSCNGCFHDKIWPSLFHCLLAHLELCSRSAYAVACCPVCPSAICPSLIFHIFDIASRTVSQIELKLGGRHWGYMEIQNCLNHSFLISKMATMMTILKIFKWHLLLNCKSD